MNIALRKPSSLLIHDENVDTLLAILTPQAMTKPTQTAALLGKIKLPAGKTILASWMGGRSNVRRKTDLSSIEDSQLRYTGTSHSRPFPLASIREQTTSAVRDPKDLHSNHIASNFDRAQFLKSKQHPTESVLLTEVESKQWMESYGIPTTSIDVADVCSASRDHR